MMSQTTQQGAFSNTNSPLLSIKLHYLHFKVVPGNVQNTVKDRIFYSLSLLMCCLDNVVFTSHCVILLVFKHTLYIVF